MHLSSILNVRDDQLENENTIERMEAQLEPWSIKSIIRKRLTTNNPEKSAQ